MKEILDKEKILADLKYWQVPGMAVSYVKVFPDKDGGYAPDSFAGGYGVRETGGEPVDENTRFCIASCSKAMTSAVIAMLVTEGKLSYDVPVKEYLPGFAMMDAEADEKMTLRDMLCHRTGLAPHDGTWAGVATSEEYMRRFRHLAPCAPFRSKAIYNNCIYGLAGHVVEAVTGLDLEEAFRKYLFGPLGMENSSCDTEKLRHSENHAEPYQVIDGRLTKLEIWNVDTVAGAASVNTTASDMVKWLAFLAAGGRTADGRQLIAPEVFREMTEKHMDYADFVGEEFYPLDGYALGWQVGSYRGKKILRHTGKIEGYSTVQAFVPEEGIGVFVTINLHAPSIEVMFAELYQALDALMGYGGEVTWTGKFHGSEPPKPEDYTFHFIDVFEKRYPDAVETEWDKIGSPERYAGTYENPGYDHIEIRAEGGELTLTNRALTWKMKPYFGGLFKVIGLKEDTLTYVMPVSFIENEDGAVEGLMIPMEPLIPDLLFRKK